VATIRSVACPYWKAIGEKRGALSEKTKLECPALNPKAENPKQSREEENEDEDDQDKRLEPFGVHK